MSNNLLLLDKLVVYRNTISKLKNVNPVLVLNNEMIKQIIQDSPKTFKQLNRINGIGKKKIELYGTDILNIVNNKQLNYSAYLNLPKPLNLSNKNQLWILFDLETTGLSWYKDSIIQCCIRFISKKPGLDYKILETTTNFVKTEKNIPPHVTELTKITPDLLIDAPSFSEVFMSTNQIIDNISKLEETQDVIWLAHNGFRFDFPFWYKNMLDNSLVNNQNLNHWFTDTLPLVKNIEDFSKLENYKLETLHKHIFGKGFDNAHRADADVEALTNIFFYNKVQEGKLSMVYPESYFNNYVLEPPKKRPKESKTKK